MLHLALRNKKWLIRTACVSVHAADACVKNSDGVSPAGLQIRTTGNRLFYIGGLASAVWLEFVPFGTAGPYVAAGFLLVATVDLLLAVRWWCTAFWINQAKRLNTKPSTKAKHDSAGSGSAKKKR